MKAKECKTACAPPMDVVWHQINWVKSHSYIRRLQARIVKATKENRWGKVKALQHLLTHSFSGKVLAVKRVTENQGKRTAGVDGILWSHPEAKSEALKTLKQRGYRPQPLRRVLIPKSNGGKRPLGIPTMKDRAMQALYMLALVPIAETTADLNSYGFRPERCCADAIAQCFHNLSKPKSAKWVLEGDIKGCFDNISHEWMINNIPMDKVILKKWLKAGYVENSKLFPTEAGTPQGGIISPVLANMVLDGLEKLFDSEFERINGKQRRTMINVVRYADDFVITGRSREQLTEEVMPKVVQFLTTRGLVLSKEKTKITHIDDGFDFLGQNIRKYDNKLLIKPSKKSVTEFLRKIRKIIKENAAVSQAILIKRLNPIILGWGEYHKHVVSSEIFNRIKSEIWLMLWRWTRRRHPNKGRKWMVNKYYQTINNRHWVFATSDIIRGKKQLCVIRNMADTKIRRHVKIRNDANPFDPEWEQYFEERLGFKMVNSLRGRQRLLQLWLSQNGICPICNQKITNDTGWHNHHIIWKVLGGSDGNSNRILVHQNCHNMIHSQKLSVKKPAPVKRGLPKA